MSRFVFVLGAGASAAAGAPVAADFMDKARSLLRRGVLGAADAEAFELVFKARDALKAVHSKASLELENLEVLFNAFEMAALFNRLQPLSEQEVQALPQAMQRLIGRTIEKSLIFPVEPALITDGALALADKREKESRRIRFTDSLPGIYPPHPYDRFAELVSKISSGSWSDICVITFNYDVACDFSFEHAEIPYDYGLGERLADKVNLLKLHGSLNWRRCMECKAIVSWPLRDFLKKIQLVDLAGKSQIHLEISLHIPDQGHCHQPLSGSAVIVPPTWSKGFHHSQLAQVWRKAAQHLSEAEYIYIIGYSYPSTDEFFKYLYALGSVGDGWPQEVHVINPDHNVSKRIETLLGPLTKSKFKSSLINFEEAIKRLIAQKSY